MSKNTRREFRTDVEGSTFVFGLGQVTYAELDSLRRGGDLPERLSKPKPKTDAAKKREWQAFVKRITPEAWAEFCANDAKKKTAEDDARDAKTASRRKKIGESLRARVELEQDDKLGMRQSEGE